MQIGSITQEDTTNISSLSKNNKNISEIKDKNTSQNGFGLSESDLNLNSLLVKRQIDNPSPGAVTGGN